jgi:hypothetical protein
MPELDLLQSEEVDSQLLDLITGAPMPGLGVEPSCLATARKIETILDALDLNGSKVEAALWLLAGDLERSHLVSQSIPDDDGSYWHGIMHRREGDFSNAKYWFRKADQHPILRPLQLRITDEFGPSGGSDSELPVAELVQSRFLPGALVDLVQRAVSGAERLTPALEQVSWWEWQLLFRHCYSPLRHIRD